MRNTIRGVISKFLAAVMTCVMAFSVVNAGGAVAYAAETLDVPLWVGGEQVKLQTEGGVVTGSWKDTTGKAEYTGDATSGTLILTDYSYEGKGQTTFESTRYHSAGILWKGSGTLTIHIKGDNIITQTGRTRTDSSEGEYVYGIFTYGDDNDIYTTGVEGNIVITGEDDATLTVTGGENTGDSGISYGICTENGNLTIKGGTITATGGYAVFSYGYFGWKLDQSGGTFNAIGSDSSYSSEGITVLEYGITLTGGEINATSGGGYLSSTGIYETGGFSISNGAKCTAKASNVARLIQGLSQVGTGNAVITVDGGTLICEACDGGMYSYGLDSGDDSYPMIITDDPNSVFISSGYGYAVKGSIKNSIPGNGWDDAEGNGEGTEITINETGANLDFKRVEFPKGENEQNGSGDPDNPDNPSEPEITDSDNKPMTVSTETIEGDYKVEYAHEIPFYGKGKITPELFGDKFTVSQGSTVYKVTKIKVKKKKNEKNGHIQITGLENADKKVVKAVKKATKGDKGIPFSCNPYYVKDSVKNVTVKAKKDGTPKSVKVKINDKDYKAKKDEWEYSADKKAILFKGNNLAGSWTYPEG